MRTPRSGKQLLKQPRGSVRNPQAGFFVLAVKIAEIPPKQKKQGGHEYELHHPDGCRKKGHPD